MIPTNKGYILMGLQGVKGSAVTTPDLAVPFLDDGFSTNQQINGLKDGGDNEYLLENMKMEHRENFSFSINARPDIATYLTAFMLGDRTVTATADPYTHTITRGEREWLTIERQLTTTSYQRLVDCKFENMTITGEAGKPVRISVDGNALTATMRTTGYSETYDTERTFMFYDGSSRFKIDTTNSSLIKGFSINININSGGGLRDDRYEIIDLPDFNYSVDCTLDIYTTDTTRFKKINYNTSTTPQPDFATGAFEVDCQYSSTTTRQLKITVPNLTWQSIGGVNMNPEGSTMVESIAGVAVKQSTTELMTIVCQNSVNTDGLQDNDDNYLLDNNDQVLIGVY
jgi:hypothetical protein